MLNVVELRILHAIETAPGRQEQIAVAQVFEDGWTTIGSRLRIPKQTGARHLIANA